jgi:hypothetical protein
VVKRASPFGNEGEYIEKGFNFKVILTGVMLQVDHQLLKQ